jgi:hypothetical protein
METEVVSIKRFTNPVDIPPVYDVASSHTSNAAPYYKGSTRSSACFV